MSVPDIQVKISFDGGLTFVPYVKNTQVAPSPASTPTPTSVATFPIYDNFDQAVFNITQDGITTPNGLWKAGYVSGGYAKILGVGGNQYLSMSPALDRLHAARLDTTKSWKGVHGKASIRLDEQCQYNLQSWFTWWLMLAYVNETTHYYFNLKTNGWELGKKDNDLDPALEHQEYLLQGSTPKVALGVYNTIEWWVVPELANLRIKVNINGVTVANKLDDQFWERGGQKGYGASKFFVDSMKKVALYSEASRCSYDNVYIGEALTI